MHVPRSDAKRGRSAWTFSASPIIAIILSGRKMCHNVLGVQNAPGIFSVLSCQIWLFITSMLPIRTEEFILGLEEEIPAVSFGRVVATISLLTFLCNENERASSLVARASLSSAKRGDLTEDRVPSHDNENGGGGLDQPPSLTPSLSSLLLRRVAPSVYPSRGELLNCLVGMCAHHH